MAKDTTVKKFKKNDFSEDFEYGRSEPAPEPKKTAKKKHRSANPNKNFDHLRADED